MEWIEVPTEGSVKTVSVTGPYDVEDERAIVVELSREILFWIDEGNNVAIDLRETQVRSHFVEALKSWTKRSASRGRHLVVFADSGLAKTLEQVHANPRIEVVSI